MHVSVSGVDDNHFLLVPGWRWGFGRRLDFMFAFDVIVRSTQHICRVGSALRSVQ